MIPPKFNVAEIAEWLREIELQSDIPHLMISLGARPQIVRASAVRLWDFRTVHAFSDTIESAITELRTQLDPKLVARAMIEEAAKLEASA